MFFELRFGLIVESADLEKMGEESKGSLPCMVACDDVSSSKELLLGQDLVGVYWEKKKKKKDEKKIWTIDLKSSKSNGAKVVFYGGRHDKFPNLASTK